MLISFMVRPKPRRGQCRSARFPGAAPCETRLPGSVCQTSHGRRPQLGRGGHSPVRVSSLAREGAGAGKPAVTKTTRVFSKRAIWRQRWTRAATVD